jgi:hypothetical protein
VQNQIRWNYRFSNPRAVEGQEISYRLREDISKYGGFLLRLHVDNPTYLDLYVILVEADGDTIEWRLDQDSGGWIALAVTDLSTQGKGPQPWDPGDQQRNLSAIRQVKFYADDTRDYTRVLQGAVDIVEFKLLDPTQAYHAAWFWNRYLENEIARKLDLWAIGRMDHADGWMGPRPEHIGISEEGTEGSLVVDIDLEAGHHLRLERNLLAVIGPARWFYPEADVMRAADLSSAASIGFDYRTELSGPSRLLFRLWDRAGGFVEWEVLSGVLPSEWTHVSLNIPSGEASQGINLKTIGGLNWELQTLGQPVAGRMWLDELLVSAGSRGAIEPLTLIGTHPIPIPAALPSLPAEPGRLRPVHLILSASNTIHGFADADAAQVIRAMQEHLEVFSDAPGLEYWLGTFDPRDIERHGEAKMSEVIVEVASWLERKGVPFYLTVGGYDGLSITPEILEAALDAAPNTCLGGLLGEPYEPMLDPTTLVALERMLDTLAARDRVLLFINFADSWWKLSWSQAVMSVLFSPDHREVTVPMWENLEPSCLSLNMGATLGLWTAGRSASWGASIQSWGWNNMQWTTTNDMPARDWQQTLIGAVAMGAEYIEVQPESALRGPSLEAFTDFARMLHAGTIAVPASPADLVSLPSVALRTIPPYAPLTWAPGFIRCAISNPWERSEALPAVTLASILYESSHYYEDILPETPYGLVAVLPPGPVPEGVEPIGTNGQGVRSGERWVYGEEARDVVEAAYVEGASDMPLAAEGCTFSAIRIGEGDYLAYLIDPEERFPAGVSTFVSVQLEGSWTAYDWLSGEELPSTAEGVPVEIPPGGFRLVRILAAPSG